MQVSSCYSRAEQVTSTERTTITTQAHNIERIAAVNGGKKEREKTKSVEERGEVSPVLEATSSKKETSLLLLLGLYGTAHPSSAHVLEAHMEPPELWCHHEEYAVRCLRVVIGRQKAGLEAEYLATATEDDEWCDSM